MIDDERPFRDVAARLREGAADRVPVALRPASRPGVPLAATVAALVLAVVLGAALLLSRAQAGSGSEVVVPARPAASDGGGSGGWAGRAGGGRVAAGSGQAGPGSGPLPPASVATGGPPGVQSSEVVVDVTGRVRRSGVVRLPAGSRVWDAVVAAGGATGGARLDRLNLARRLADGEQVVVPGPNDPPPAAAAPTAAPAPAASGAAGPGMGQIIVDLNTATADQLDGLPGVGPVLAARILAWRAQHGRFTRVDELGEVAGIGDKLLAQVRPRVRV